jgi:uncharacterized protein with PQ loop repeat
MNLIKNIYMEVYIQNKFKDLYNIKSMIEYYFLFNTLGYIGSSMIGIMLIPQVYLTIKTNKTDDLSILFLIMNMTAVSNMIPYSIYFELYPVLIANSSVGICNSILLYHTVKNQYVRNKTESSEIEII